MSCRLQQCSSSFERKAGGGKGTLQTLNTHLASLQLAALSFSSAVQKENNHQTSTTKGMQEELFLYRLRFPKALSRQQRGKEELQSTLLLYSCWENTRKDLHWERAMLSWFQRKGWTSVCQQNVQLDAPAPGSDGKSPQVPRVLGWDHLPWDYKQERRFAEINLRRGNVKLSNI